MRNDVAMKQTRVLSLGAGVQSTTVALLAVHGLIEPVEHAIFADTQIENQATYQHLKRLIPIMEKAGIKTHIVTVGNLGGIALKSNYNPIPSYLNGASVSLGRRQCTYQHKIRPIVAKQRELIGLQKGQRWKPENGNIINLMGISVDEIQRAKDNRVKYIKNHFPLLDLRMKRTDCLAWLDKHGYTAPRSACYICPYHSDKEWRELKKSDEWHKIVKFDEDMRKKYPDTYLHKSGKPIDKVDLRTEEEKGQYTLFDNECEGMCGL